MPEYSDIYVLSRDRSESGVYAFLDQFIPVREETAEEYEYPQFSESSREIYYSADDIVSKCSKEATSEYCLYWRANKNVRPEHATVIYLKDGCIAFGLSTDASDRKYAVDLLAEMKAFLRSSLGYIGHEGSPDFETFEDFDLQVKIHEKLWQSWYGAGA